MECMGKHVDVALWFLRTHHDFDGDLMFCADIKEENSGKRQLTFENLDRNRFFFSQENNPTAASQRRCGLM